MHGLSGLSDVVARLERRFACGVIPDLENSDDDAYAGEAERSEAKKIAEEEGRELVGEVSMEEKEKEKGKKKGKKRKRARKATKEEQQWLEEGQGFLDDAEAVDDVNRLEAERKYELGVSGFYVYRGCLSELVREEEAKEERSRKKKKGKRKRVFSEAAQERMVNAEEKLPYAVTKPLQRVKDVLKGLGLEESNEALAQGFPKELDSALMNLERTMRKNVENHTEDLRYLSLLMELLPIEEELVYLNMERLRLQMRCKWLTNAYNKSMTELRKIVKAMLDALPAVEKNKHKGNPQQWNNVVASLFTTSAMVKLKPSQEVAEDLQELYAVSFTAKEKKMKAKAKSKKSKAKAAQPTWEEALSKLERVASKLEARGDELGESPDEAEKKALKSAKEICALTIGLLLRTSEKKKPFKWDAESKKLLRQIGLTHRKIAIQTVKLRNLELQTCGKIKSWCRSRSSMLKHVCDVWPARYMQPEEVTAITIGSTSRLPIDAKLAAPEGAAEAGMTRRASQEKSNGGGTPSKGKEQARKAKSLGTATSSPKKKKAKVSPSTKDKKSSGKVSSKAKAKSTKTAKNGAIKRSSQGAKKNGKSSPKKSKSHSKASKGRNKSQATSKIKSSDLFEKSVFEDESLHAEEDGRKGPKRGYSFDQFDVETEWERSDFPEYIPP